MGVYRALVRLLLPARLARRHGAAMEALFGRELERARRSGRLRWAGAWLAGVWDVLRWAGREWAGRLGRGEGSTMETTMRDTRLAARRLARRPGLTGLVVAMLALGIGACTGVFTLVDGIFLRPLPYPEPDRLVYLNETAPRWGLELAGINYPDFHRWRKGAEAFESMTVFDGGSFILSGDGRPEWIRGMLVTRGFEEVLGLDMLLGRGFTAEEDAPGGPPVVALGEDLWRSRFGASPDILGTTVRLNAVARTVVGIFPSRGAFPEEGQLWVPLAADPEQSWQSYNFEGLARLRPDVSLEAGLADLEHAHTAIWEERDNERVVSPLARPLHAQFVGRYRPVAIALIGGVGLLLLIACANVAGLLLARSLRQRKETSVRVALGAGAARITRETLVEGLLLAALGGGGGLLLGHVGVRLLLATAADQLPRWASFDTDMRVVLFALAATSATALLFSWAPLARVLRHDLRDGLLEQAGRSTASAGARRTLNALVAGEVALATLLLVGSGLLLRTLQRVRGADPGFRTEGVLGYNVYLPEARYPDRAAVDGFWRDMLAKTAALPGVVRSGAVTCLPLTCHWGRLVEVEGLDQPDGQPIVLTRYASAGYLEALGVRLVSGRLLDGTDRPDGEPVVVVNQTFVRTYLSGADDPLGQRIRFETGDGSGTWLRVVGVIADTRHYGLETPMRPGIFLAMGQDTTQWFRGLYFAVQGSGRAEALAPAVRDMAAAVDPEIPLYQVHTLEEAWARASSLRLTFSAVLAIFAAVALVMAVGGLYGVVAYAVGQRTHEIGIRVTLGARGAQVVGLFVRHGVGVAVVGLGVGGAVAWALAPAASSVLLGVPPRDPVTFAAVVGVLLTTACAATLVPVWRALAVDPRATLREE